MLCIHVRLFSFSRNPTVLFEDVVNFRNILFYEVNRRCSRPTVYRIRLILLSFSRQVQVTNLYARVSHHNRSIIKLPNKLYKFIIYF